MSTPEVLVAADQDALAADVAARLIDALAAAQEARGTASVVVPGGGVGIASLAAVAASPERDRVAWDRLDVWWGDERFVASDSEDRNERQAREALLDYVPLDPARVHPMAASDGPYDAEQAAESYAELLPVDLFDVLVLGMGPEGHTASIFPGSPASHDTRAVCAVFDCPKPPPTRISLTFSTLSRSREAWLVAAGEAKAAALRAAWDGAAPDVLPAGAPRGTERTLWLLDEAAASLLPH